MTKRKENSQKLSFFLLKRHFKAFWYSVELIRSQKSSTKKSQTHFELTLLNKSLRALKLYLRSPEVKKQRSFKSKLNTKLLNQSVNALKRYARDIQIAQMLAGK